MPIIRDIIDKINVAADAQSLAIFANDFLSNVTKSTFASSALLISSHANTSPKHSIIMHHSILVTSKVKPI